MKTMRQHKYLFALLMLLAVFAACKGESPTAPTSTSGGGGGTITPPTGSVVTLSVSNANPFVSSQSIVTATVTLNGQPVPNGTAVEFTTDFGTFFETGTKSALRTTTNGVATVTLTSSTAGKATIQAVVNNVSKTTTVTFQLVQEPTCPPNCPATHPTITSISPTFGSPGGGETVTITGTKFTQPVRVFFDFGAGTTPKEAFVVSRTDTQIVVTTPPVDLGTGQTKNATIVVITEAGSTTEERVTSPSPFVFQAEVLTPTVSAVSPDSGPIDGGTRITIFGSGFQAPVQVSFAPGATAGAAGWTAIQVVSVSFTQIVAITPTAREVNPNGSGTLTGAVDLRVRNINSDKEVVKPVFFRYTAKSQITAFGPGSGTAFGGTHVVIDGVGFNDPVTVTIAGIVAQPIKVTGTQVTAITGPTASPCSPPSGSVVVTNIDNGDSAASTVGFTYQAEKPLITGFVVSSPPPNPGGNVAITVIKPGVGLDGTGLIRFTFGTGATAATVFPTPSVITNPVGPITFSMPIPNVDFPTVACTTGAGLAGTRLGDVKIPVTFTNITTGCTDTIQNFVISPPGPNACNATSPSAVAVINPTTFCPNGFGSHATGSSTPMLITVSNTTPVGGQNLQISNATITGADFNQFSVTPTSLTVAPGQSGLLTVTFAPTSSGLKAANLTLVTNDPARPTINVCLEGTAP